MNDARDKFIRAISEGLDARNDDSIRNYFVDTRVAQGVRARRSGSMGLVGLKGTGKTTLFRALTQEWFPEPDVVTIPISPTSSAFESANAKANCLQFEQSVRRGMAIMLLDRLDGTALHSGNLGSEWLKRRAALLSETGAVGKVLRRFKGFSVLGCGMQWNAEASDEADFSLSPQDDNRVLEHLRAATSAGINIRVVLDDADRLFTRQTKLDVELMSGYVLGTHSLSAKIPGLVFVNILKSHVYEAMKSIEEIANLPIDYFSHILWTRDELVEVLDSRMSYAGVGVSDIFEDDKAVCVDLMIESIRNGPRDLLRYIEIILKASASAKISKLSIETHRHEFKRKAREQMKTVYNGIYDGIDALATTAIGPKLTVGEFHTRFDEARMASEPASVDYKAPWLSSGASALRAMLEAGVLDVQVDGRWLRPFDQGYFTFDPDEPTGAIRVNAVFR
ncbi:MAG: hypothetical protein Q8S53_12215 [Brevundimonas sp.]|uniref:P-loop ATPase, Sll1717 family n=1 Tax=Brevundimonas sp. TaxID=1871086 RepID=UPI0027349BA6|nr:hypothetical protein [Brevundimonas sp.]MDP3379119.1 hypothetical protein [Brevundimonas sp.]